MRTLIGCFAGAAVGLLGGLLALYLVNANCDSISEQLAGCTRYQTGPFAVCGLLVGFLLGAMIGALLDVSSARRR